MIDLQLDGAHPEHRIAIEGLIRALCAEFPWVPLKAVRLYDGDEDDRSLGNADTPGTISLNRFWFAQDPAVLQAAALEGYMVPIGGHMIGWHGDMVEEPEHVITHEFFHIAVTGDADLLKQAEQARLSATHDITLAPAGYALSTADEFAAEALTASRMGGDHPRPRPDMLHMPEVS